MGGREGFQRVTGRRRGPVDRIPVQSASKGARPHALCDVALFLASAARIGGAQSDDLDPQLLDPVL